MSDDSEPPQRKEKPERQRARTLFYLVAALMVPVIVYFSYDLAQGLAFPCESIFRQAQASLKTKLKFIGTEGELQVGPEQVQELSERATMTALNLKTCCQVLDAGKLDPEQFLQCKQETRNYEADLERLVRLVRETPADDPSQPASGGNAQSAADPEIASAVQAARSTSQAFNERVVEIRREQAMTQLETTPPQQVDIEAQEKEPNNDILNTNVVDLDTLITGAIADPEDDDFYLFTSPGTYRDFLEIKVENRSTTLRPHLYLYDQNKSRIASHGSDTAGADIVYRFVSEPDQKHYVQVRNWNRSTTGAYLLRVSPIKAYDTFEPNESILEAKAIDLDAPIEASIMDPNDDDYFKVQSGSEAGPLRVLLENLSTTLRPYFYLYDGTKARIGGHGNDTPGADINTQIDAAPDTTYYIQVRNWNRGSAGDYRLTVTQP